MTNSTGILFVFTCCDADSLNTAVTDGQRLGGSRNSRKDAPRQMAQQSTEVAQFLASAIKLLTSANNSVSF
jgi:hypothetical protein